MSSTRKQAQRQTTTLRDAGLLLGRAVAGTLVAGHGAQKLFGWFEGPGLSTWTTVVDQHLGMKPAKMWAPVGALGEFGGGALTTLGFLDPLGPIAMGSMMLAASYKGHWGKPVWSAKGGAELALSFLAVAAVVGTQGPGRYSMDALFGVRVPRWITALTLLGSAGLLAETVRPTLIPLLVGPAAASQAAAQEPQPEPAAEQQTS